MRTTLVIGAAMVMLSSVLAGSAGGGGGGDSPVGVGVVTTTFVDDSRVTPRSGDAPERPERTLTTTIWYPAEVEPGTTVPDAPPDRASAPYPLIVFSPGLGATPATYERLASTLAAAGYVVMSPAFPLSGGNAGPPDAADVANQPGDISFLIDQVESAPEDDPGPLGVVDRESIGVAGHSNGGITTLGLIAHDCCRDDRIDAAAVLAGTAAPFPGGRYRLADTPPVLVVHGDQDVQVSYDDTVRSFNRMRGPKAHLTILGGDHGSSALLGGGPGAETSVASTMVDFFDGYLRDDAAAIRRLPDDDAPGATTIVAAPKEGSKREIPIAAPVEYERTATVSPRTGLHGGDVVVVHWEGFSPGGVINIVQCGDPAAASAGCDLTKGIILRDDPTGEGTLDLEIVEGPVGNQTCDAEHRCYVVFNDDSSSDPASLVRVPIRFAR